MKNIFIDRDGVLNKNITNGYVLKSSEFKWLPGALEALKLLNQNNWNVFIITNQACVNKKLLSVVELNVIHKKMITDVTEHGGKIRKVYYCPHKSEEKCYCRKPKPGLILQACAEYNLDLSSSFLIGDAMTDLLAAEKVGITPLFVLTGRGNEFYQQVLQEKKSIKIFKDVLSAVRFVIEKE